MDELLEAIAGAKYLTRLDMKNGFNLVRMKHGDKWKTAFRTKYGQFEYLVMPFGLCNARATFQRMMNTIFQELLDKGVVVFINDILIYTHGLKEEHTKLILQVLEKCKQHGLVIKFSKCEFYKQELRFLGYIVSGQGIKIDKDFIEAITQW
jgi:hypothetical protein